MNRKAKGNRNEYKTMRLLRKSGYECFRMAGSFGVFDVIGISPREVQLVQVKSNRPPSAAETAAIRLLGVPSVCRKLIHIWKDRERVPIIKEL